MANTNITLSTALAQVLALSDADKHVVLTTLIALGTSPAPVAPTPVAQSTTAKPERDYSDLAPATDVELPITLVKKGAAGKGKIAFSLGFGAGREGAKLMIKCIPTGKEGQTSSLVWDASLADAFDGDKPHKGAWVATSAQAKVLGLTTDSTTLHVPAEWVQKGRDKAASK